VKDLRQIPIFARCSRVELELIDFLMCETQIPPGRVLVQEGLPAGQMFMVVSGRACISHGGETLGIAGPGTCVAGREMRARIPNRSTVTALTPMVVRVSSAAEFRSLFSALSAVDFFGSSGELVFDEPLFAPWSFDEPARVSRSRERVNA
jgi:CRP-like cAMP-binding protein